MSINLLSNKDINVVPGLLWLFQLEYIPNEEPLMNFISTVYMLLSVNVYFMTWLHPKTYKYQYNWVLSLNSF